MHKVVYNNCYGSFILSIKAIDWLEEHGTNIVLYDCIQAAKARFLNKENQPKGEEHLCCAISKLFDSDRTHPDLVAVVEALRGEASGPGSNLAVEEIDSDLYRIEEYRGYESVIALDKPAWISVNN